jgi:hypothetical protein
MQEERRQRRTVDQGSKHEKRWLLRHFGTAAVTAGSVGASKRILQLPDACKDLDGVSRRPRKALLDRLTYLWAPGS